MVLRPSDSFSIWTSGAILLLALTTWVGGNIHHALAEVPKRPLPSWATAPACPDKSQTYVNDSAQVISVQTRWELEASIKSMMASKKHQVVIYTFKDLMGFPDLHTLTNYIGQNCGIGFAGANNGLVVGYNEKTWRARIETARTEIDFTDARVTQILIEGKARAIANKKPRDVGEILKYVLQTIDKDITPEMVQDAVQKIEAHTAQKNKEWWNMVILVWGIILIVIAWASWYYWRRKRKNRNSWYTWADAAIDIVDLGVTIARTRRIAQVWGAIEKKWWVEFGWGGGEVSVVGGEDVSIADAVGASGDVANVLNDVAEGAWVILIEWVIPVATEVGKITVQVWEVVVDGAIKWILTIAD
jgi:uncharacterized membrane protein YgcG